MARLNRRNRRNIQQSLEGQLTEIVQNTMGDTAVRVETVSESHHSGPLPSPDTLAEYERLIPGLAGTIIAEAASESAFRREFHKDALAATIQDGVAERRIEERGQHYAFIIVMVFSVIGGISIFTGHEKSGVALVGGAAVSFAGLFIWGRAQKAANASKPIKPLPDPPSPKLPTLTKTDPPSPPPP